MILMRHINIILILINMKNILNHIMMCIMENMDNYINISFLWIFLWLTNSFISQNHFIIIINQIILHFFQTLAYINFRDFQTSLNNELESRAYWATNSNSSSNFMCVLYTSSSSFYGVNSNSSYIYVWWVELEFAATCFHP